MSVDKPNFEFSLSSNQTPQSKERLLSQEERIKKKKGEIEQQ